MTTDLRSTLGAERPLVGMVHLPPLPGSPGYPGSAGDRESIRECARADARALADGGVDAVLVENYGDAPFYPESVPAHVVADVTAAVRAVERAVECPVGVNVLRNDAEAALSAAAAGGGEFIRVNVHTGAAVTDQGVIEGKAHETLRLADRIDAGDLALFADVDVKHAAPLGDRPFRERTRDLVERGGVDGVVVTGEATGEPTPVDAVRRTREAVADAGAEGTPVLVGSGVTPDNVREILAAADGAIVGTSLKESGVTEHPVDSDRVRALVAAADEVR
ncbi:phosphorybosylanthranilate isomerase [Halobacteriales archaeon QS_8_69_26]|nr:MAG: phosphorybosylanthranilate isomerase [Halobacteriales archaeon QS_8_69_26]